MQDLLRLKNSLVKQLTASVKELRTSATNYAQAEHDYKILVSTEALKLRDSGTAVSMINLVVYGLPSVAKARFDRDVALGIYEANKEAINSIKLQLRLIGEQMQREWTNENDNAG